MEMTDERHEAMCAHLKALEAENERLDRECADATSGLAREVKRCVRLEAELVEMSSRLSRANLRVLRMLEEKVAAPVDPDAPRRFEWDDTGEWGRDVRRGVYFPATNVWVGDLGVSHFGGPQMPGIRWLDPSPAPASEGEAATAESASPARSEEISPESGRQG
jgi:hypothetical protein